MVFILLGNKDVPNLRIITNYYCWVVENQYESMINDYYLEYILDINDYLDVYICSHRDDVRFVADGLSQRSGEHRDLVV